MADDGCLNTDSTLPLASEACEPIPRRAQPQRARSEAALDAAARTSAAPPAGVAAAILLRAGARYEVGTLLGRGGGGRVYRGFDRTLRRQVAIKVLHGEQADARRVALFDREVRLLARLQHPHLIPLYDAWQDDRCRYLVMPLVQGATLAGRIASGPVPADEVQRIATALAQALAYIHGLGIVHRDIKPSNVLLGRDGQIFLADFGIARSDEGDYPAARPGFLVGTAAYLAPEQVWGDEAGPACDVYALGLVLLEALTATRAYRGTTLEQALARIRRQPEIPVSLGPGWVRLLDAMTARDAARRPDAASLTGRLHRPESAADPVDPVDPVAPQAAAPDPPITATAIRPRALSPARRRWRASAATALCVGAFAAGALTVIKPSPSLPAPAAPPHARAAQSPATLPATAPAVVTPKPAAVIPVAVSAPAAPTEQAELTGAGTAQRGRSEPPDHGNAAPPHGGGTDAGRGRGGGRPGRESHAHTNRSGAHGA